MIHPKHLEDFNCQIKEHRHFILEKVIGSGSYGIVFRAKIKGQNKQVAIKKLCNVFASKIDTQRALRELKFMNMLKHPNIIGYHGILTPMNEKSFQNIYIIEELMDGDLRTFIRYNYRNFTPLHHKTLMYQVLLGIDYLHKLNIYHRDIKPSNILVNTDCVAKICDFGLSRFRYPEKVSNAWTDYIATRWYRAPEICGAQDMLYTKGIDIWSVGCIFAELFLGRPLFRGNDSREQLLLITSVLGLPSHKVLHESYCENARKLLQNKKIINKTLNLENFTEIKDKNALDIISKMLDIDPSKRITVRDALKHSYFDEVRNTYTFNENKLIYDILVKEFDFDNYYYTENFDKHIIDEIHKQKPSTCKSFQTI